MTLAEQSALLIEAGEAGLLETNDFVRWADSIIGTTENPPNWVFDLSALNSKYVSNYLSLLRESTSVKLPIRQRIQWIIRGYEAGQFSLDKALQKCFEIVIYESNQDLLSESEDLLGDLLVEWDCRDFVIDQPLRSKFEKLFHDYLTDAEQLESILPWKSNERS